MDFKNLIRTIPDFPKEGILFKDICPLLLDSAAWNEIVQNIGDFVDLVKPDLIASVEARGFLIGSAVATYKSLGFVPIRKSGKLPGEKISIEYELEYGVDILEIQVDAFRTQKKVLLIDDLLATGGTANAGHELINKAGGELLGYAFIIELCSLNGRDNLSSKLPVKSIVSYS